MEILEDRRLLAIGPVNLTAGEGLATYKFALATTVEFTQAVCSVSPACDPQASSEAVQRSVTSAALDSIIDSVNEVYQQELAIRFELVPDNDFLISTGNAASDGYTDSNAGALTSQNGPQIESRLGATTGVGERNEYDIGHVLAITAGGGLATLGAVGQPTKAQGATSASVPVTLDQSNAIVPTPSFLGILIHEVGHQFGAEHTFNGVSGSCLSRSVDSSYEPGSGSSIMAYQGICGSDNLPVEPGDERYFHAASFDEIYTLISTEIPDLRPPVANGNTLPSIDAGPDFTIPASTPFALTATGSDPDNGDVITYSWEQIDLGSENGGQSVPIPDSADHEGPLFRSFAPTTDPTRTFPRLSDILANTDPATNRGEHLPTQSRELNFRVTVRDNHNAGGSIVSGIRSDDVRLNVVDTGEAFRITSPNTAVTWAGGTTETVTWAVAGTTGNGIDVTSINLRLSTDGGNTYPILLGSFPNNGSAQIRVPNLPNGTNQARIKAEGAGNIFFDVSDQNLTISASTGPGVTFTETADGTQLREDSTISTDQYQVALDSTPSGDVTVTVTADPQSEISLTGAAGSFSESQSIVLSDTSAQAVFVRALDDVVVEGTHTSTLTHAITATDDATNYPRSLTLPSLTATVLDNDTSTPSSGSGGLVGIDFDPISGSTPTNWTRVDVSTFGNPFVLENLPDEAGNATTIDLLFDDNTGSGTSSPSSGTIPQHTPSLAGVDGLLYSGPFQGVITPIDVTWTGLTPGFEYDLYVFAVENFGDSYNQRVTITGEGTPVVFDQITTNGVLLVNDEVGNNGRTLESYAERITANEFGTIRVRVEANAGSGGIVLPGLAIQEVVPATTIDAINAGGLIQDEGDDSTTPFTFSVTRSGDVSSAATVDFVVSPSGGNPVDVNDFGGNLPSGQVQFDAGQSVSQTVTLNVVGETDIEPDERFTVTLSNPSDGARLNVISSVGTIRDDDDPSGSNQITLDTIGLYQPDAPLFHLRNSLSAGGSDQFFAFGPGSNAGWIPLSGDWDGDGTDTIGLYQPDVSLFHLKNSFTPGASDQYFAFGPGGNAGWIPLVGDWNGNGVDTIGLYQPDISLFHLKDSFTPGASDQYFAFGPGGNAGWIPLTGDWNGDGIDTIGLYQPDISLFHLKDSFTPGASDQYFAFGPGGNAGWTPMVGDWNGDGTDTIGLYQPDVSQFHLKDSFTPGASDYFFSFGPGGNAGWTPLSGDWNGPSAGGQQRPEAVYLAYARPSQPQSRPWQQTDAVLQVADDEVPGDRPTADVVYQTAEVTSGPPGWTTNDVAESKADQSKTTEHVESERGESDPWDSVRALQLIDEVLELW